METYPNSMTYDALQNIRRANCKFTGIALQIIANGNSAYKYCNNYGGYNEGELKYAENNIIPTFTSPKTVKLDLSNPE